MGGRHVYRAGTRADADGRFELVLPYPTDQPWSSAVAADGTYTLRRGAQRTALEVPEAAVRSGAVVAAGPDAAPGP